MAESKRPRRRDEGGRSEHELLASALERLDEPVVLGDGEGRIVRINAAFGRAAGLAPAEAAGRELRSLAAGPEAEAAIDAACEATASGASWRGRLAARRTDGTPLELDAAFSPLGSGGAEGFVALLRDATAEAALQREVEQARRVEALGRMAGGIAHDFNNLLGVIRGYAELLQRYPHGPGELAASLDEIVKAADRGARLTAQLLAYGRRQILRPQAVELRATLAGLDETLRRLLGDAIALEVRTPEPAWARVDPGRLEQVVTNLVVNARDAMPSGGTMTIELVARGAGDGLGAPRLSFRDTGEGMPPEVLEHAFEPFFTTKRTGKGSGLGLAAVYGIVVQSGGSITVASEPGAGTTVEITLPPVPEREIPADEASPSPPARDARPSVLVVEAQELLRGLVERALAESGHRVLGAPDVDEALRLAACEGPVDLVLCDLGPPGPGGASRAERLRAALPGAKLLFTADAGVPSPHAEGLVRKPFRLEELTRAVRAALAAPR